MLILRALEKDCNISVSALVRVLRQVREAGLPPTISDSSLVRQREALVSESTSFGALIQHVDAEAHDGSQIRIPVQHPLAFLEVACRKSQVFAEQIGRLLNRTENVVRIALYSDEITPGNVIAADNRRRLQVVYWSLLDYDALVLSQEDAWYVMCTIRSTVVKKLSGNMSGVFSQVLKLFLGRPTGSDLRDGVVLDLGAGGTRLVTGNIGLIIQDERAHKYLAHFKGDQPNPGDNAGR